MSAQAKPTFATSLTLNLYAVSMVLPFVLLVLIPRQTGLLPTVLLLDFMALVTLLITSMILSVRAFRVVHWWLYPVGAMAAVVLYSMSVKPIRKTLDYAGFWLKQEQLMLLIQYPAGSSPEQLAAAGIMRVETAQPGVTLFVEDGEASDRYWGVAYSAADEKPNNSYLMHKIYYWQHLSGHWYKWERYD